MKLTKNKIIIKKKKKIERKKANLELQSYIHMHKSTMSAIYSNVLFKDV